jgi:DNA sulfur modification protein DndD
MLIKLATIMSIITAKKATRSTDLYTLITDAPLSTFGDSYIIGFCKTVSKVYKQSIVMSKEFYQNETLKNQLLSDNEIDIGKVYILTPSLKESERETRNNLYTEIKALN